MAFHLRQNERVGKGLARIASEEVQKAIDALRYARLGDEAVHRARKHVKKIRAIVRLAERTDGARLRRADNRLREIGRALSPLRDAKAMQETIAGLPQRHDDFMVQRAVRIASRMLAERRRRLRLRAHEEQVGRTCQKALRRIKGSVGRWRLEDLKFSGALAGIKEAYREGRAAMQLARERQHDDQLHRWRRRVKVLWYHLRLLEERIDVRDLVAALNQLEEALGEDHNLVVFRACVAGAPARGIHRQHFERLDEACKEYQRELRRNALALGDRFYASKPKDFAEALRRRWQASPRRGERGPHAA